MVREVTILGGRKRQVRIWLDADKMRGLNVTADDVIQALRRENADLPGGNLALSGERAEFSVKTKGEVKSVEAFKDINWLDIGFEHRTRYEWRNNDLRRVEGGGRRVTMRAPRSVA